MNLTEEIWKVVVPHTSSLGEGPVWDISKKLLYWVDILENEIHWFSPVQGTHHTHRLDQMVGAIAFNSTGGLIAALENGFALVDIEKDCQKMIASPEVHLPDNRFNDGKCDPAGRFWAGTMSISGEPGAGNLYVVEKDLSVSTKIENVSCSNGLAWSLDNKTFYFIDTPTRQVAAYDYDIKTGNITNRRIVINTPDKDGYPDGMTIDSEGMLWIAFFDGWKVARWNPYTGEMLLSVYLPVSKITSCTFGGETLADIYITSAKEGLSEMELKYQPLAGSLFVIENSGFKGQGSYEFKG